MQEIARNAIPIHVFWRSDNKQSRFTYHGLARTKAARATSPPQFRFSFDAAAPALLPKPPIDLPLGELDPKLGPGATKNVDMNASAPDVRKALSQVALNIQQRIQLSGQERFGQHPVRKGPNLSYILAALIQKWDKQGGRCLLCGGAIPLSPKNRLLQISPDRIDSEAKTYDSANVHLTHLGCNLAKSSGTMEDWQEFLAVIRAQSAAGTDLR